MTNSQLLLEFVRVLAWPIVVLVLAIMLRQELIGLIGRLKRAELGGVSFDFDKEAAQTKRLSEEVVAAPRDTGSKPVRSLPLTEANARLLSLDMQPSPSGLDMSYYRSLATRDPNVALAGLRIEVEVLARNLAKGFGVEIGEHDSGSRLLRKLYENGSITGTQMQLAQNLLRLCDAAIHGTTVSRSQADSVIDSAEVLKDQYLSWLDWGFDDNWDAAISNDPAPDEATSGRPGGATSG